MLQTTPPYFKSIKGCEPLFAFNSKSSRIEIHLNNPNEPKILVDTGYMVVSS